jgi:hypothetical protein
MLLGKDELLKKAVPRMAKVEKHDGRYVFVRALSMSDLDDYEGENYAIDSNGKVAYNRKNLRARLLVRAICDDNGVQLFTMKDVDAIGKKDDPFFAECYKEDLKLNGLGGKEEYEIAEKNLNSAQGDVSALS